MGTEGDSVVAAWSAQWGQFNQFTRKEGKRERQSPKDSVGEYSREKAASVNSLGKAWIAGKHKGNQCAGAAVPREWGEPEQGMCSILQGPGGRGGAETKPYNAVGFSLKEILLTPAAMCG